jgi:hypothetical protein
MKIAYLFHGHSRTWKECYQSFFDNVYSVAPGDIFIHTWDRINSKYGSFWNENFDLLQGEMENISSKILDLDEIKKIYNPKNLIVELDRGSDCILQKYPTLSNSTFNLPHLAVYNMFLSQYKVFNLTEEFGDYDIYFSCRFDLIFKNKLNIEELNYKEYITTKYWQNTSLAFDVFSFGSKNVMDIKSKFYNKIWDYWYSKNIPDSYWIEHAVTEYYIDNQVQLKSSSLDFEIKRLF